MAKAALGGKDLYEVGGKWMNRIRDAGTREKEWIKAAGEAEAIYRGKQKDGAPKYYFNILHSNIETIVPAIYSATPKPDIRRRFNDKDPTGKSVATILERAITVQIDDGALDPEIEGVAQSAFAMGRGVMRVRLVETDPVSGETDDDTRETIEDTALSDKTGDDSGEALNTAPAEEPDQSKLQRLVFEAVSWRDFRFGPAKRWNDVPWVAFRHVVTGEKIREWEAQEGVISQLQATPPATSDGNDAKDGDVEVWEVWCRTERRVLFLRASDGLVYLSEDDPLGLSGFFPCARPIQPVEVVGNLEPVVPFDLYAELAQELDRVTRRIRKIIEGIKVRGGVAAGDLTKGIRDVAALDDNELAELRGVEAFAQQGGLDKAIMWWPIDKAISALQVLAQHREQIKAAIYEITGISDIVRGASNANETATAQQIKSQWGSLRIQKMQRLMERCVRDIFVISAELIASKFTLATLQEITGIEVSNEMAGLLTSRVARTYRIDVETDSTIKSDLSKSKADMTEFLGGTAQYLQSIGPAVQQGIMPPDLAIEIYSSFARIFRLGKQAEDALAQLSDRVKAQMQQAEQNPQQPQPPSPEEQKAAADMQERQARLAMDAERHQMDMAQRGEKHAQDMQIAREKAAMQQATGPAVQIGADKDELAAALAQFGQLIVSRMEQGDAALMQAIMAPREVKAIRGKDGKISGAVSAPAAIQ